MYHGTNGVESTNSGWMTSPEKWEPQYESEEERKRSEKGDNLLRRLFQIRMPVAPDDPEASEGSDEVEPPNQPPKK